MYLRHTALLPENLYDIHRDLQPLFINITESPNVANICTHYKIHICHYLYTFQKKKKKNVSGVSVKTTHWCRPLFIKLQHKIHTSETFGHIAHDPLPITYILLHIDHISVTFLHTAHGPPVYFVHSKLCTLLGKFCTYHTLYSFL